ncbi:MAG: hypothetical protein IOC42_01010 [Methylobacterium sp.]|nr:hypothetical protein [Methylobacterium sp.]MCA3668467.1 hypothetical protein [Methylobacterium sp.]MCA3675489.1 hypothetical protein [Methylobacterium sp.]
MMGPYPLFRLFVSGLAFVAGCVVGLVALVLAATAGPLAGWHMLAIPVFGLLAAAVAWVVLK